MPVQLTYIDLVKPPTLVGGLGGKPVRLSLLSLARSPSISITWEPRDSVTVLGTFLEHSEKFLNS
jgi:hypothetical protein